MSVPIRIAFVAVLAIAALWFVALRPKPVEEPAAPAVPAVGAVDAANGAAAASDAANAGVQAATGEPAAAAADAGVAAGEPAAVGQAAQPSSAPARVAVAKNDLSAPLVRHLRPGRAVVLLFTARGADDRAARDAVRGLDRRGGRVRVSVAGIGRVARYEAITTGVQVTQAPTTLVIGPDRQAQAITGYTDRFEVEQAVADALAKK